MRVERMEANMKDGTATMVKCLDCNGTSRCDTCGGTALVNNRQPCPDCLRRPGSDLPTGRCAPCQGTGKVRATPGHVSDTGKEDAHPGRTAYQEMLERLLNTNAKGNQRRQEQTDIRTISRADADDARERFLERLKADVAAARAARRGGR